MAIELKTFSDIAPKSLIRLNIQDDRTLWAIAGARSENAWWFCTFGDDSVPACFNAMGGAGIKMAYEDSIVLDYGPEFEVNPSHNETVNVMSGPLFDKAGVLVQTSAGMFIKCSIDTKPSPSDGYFSLDTGTVVTRLPTKRAAFAIWQVLLDGAARAIVVVDSRHVRAETEDDPRSA